MTAIHCPAEILEDALEWLRGDLQSDVECCCTMQREAEEIVPIAGTCEPAAAGHVGRLLELVRRIEAIAGRPVEHVNPQWLDDLIDGKWQLGPEAR